MLGLGLNSSNKKEVRKMNVHPSSWWYKNTGSAELYAELAQGGKFPLYREFAKQNISFADPLHTGLIVDGFSGMGIVTQLLRERGYKNEITFIDSISEILQK